MSSHKIDRKILDHLAVLARLTVPEDEKDQLAIDITNIVGFLDTIQRVELPDKPKAVLVYKNIARLDVVEPLYSIYDLVEVAPIHKDGFVQVPKVIE